MRVIATWNCWLVAFVSLVTLADRISTTAAAGAVRYSSVLPVVTLATFAATV